MKISINTVGLYALKQRFYVAISDEVAKIHSTSSSRADSTLGETLQIAIRFSEAEPISEHILLEIDREAIPSIQIVQMYPNCVKIEIEIHRFHVFDRYL